MIEFQNNKIVMNQKIINNNNDSKMNNNIYFKSEMMYKFEGVQKVKGIKKTTKKNTSNSKIELDWDYKTNIFKLNLLVDFNYNAKKNIGFSFFNQGKINCNTFIQFNNDPNLVIYDTSLLYELKHFIFPHHQRLINIKLNKEIGTSFSFKKPLFFSDIKTISINIKYDYPLNFYDNLNNEENHYIVKKRDDEVVNQKNIQINQEKINFYLQSKSIFSGTNNEVKHVYDVMKLEPIALQQNKHNIDFLNIIHENITPFNRIPVNIKSISNIPFSMKEFKKIDVKSNQNKIYYDENNRYDVSKEMTINEFGKNSNIGYVVPYCFSGDIYPVLTFDIGPFKDIKLSWKQTFEKPYFYKNEGIIKLDIKRNNEIIEDEQNKKLSTISQNFFEIEENKKLNYEEVLKKTKKEAYKP